MAPTGERKTAQVISQRGDGLVESSSDEIKGETSNLAQALHRIEQLESLNLKLKMEAENARKEQAEAELMFGKRLKAVSLKILDTVDTTATSLSKVLKLSMKKPLLSRSWMSRMPPTISLVVFILRASF